LLAAVVALALVSACVIGAYAHAAGHAPPAAHTAAAAGTADAGHHATASEAPPSKPGHVGNSHDCDGAGHPPLDCCDTLCHGGQAILAASLPVPHPTLCVPLIQPAFGLDGADPGGLDRPPKPFRSA
jgi:hypothetical protein